jgi:hypothetical protein
MSTSDFTANCAASSQQKNHKWLIDSATSHNMTIDLSNLMINSEYDGTDEVVIGDGSGLHVSILGHCLLNHPIMSFIYVTLSVFQPFIKILSLFIILPSITMFTLNFILLIFW